ncbi:MAG: exo-alpha-sialidase, partial [Duncaniella sp.]|nr:exo-alpha-sialidase [Duncaniella sp.]
LFYNIGSRVADWTGWLVKAKDGGRTWGEREALPEGFLGPVKNKPEIVDGRLICASSTESGGWKLHFEILDLATGEWKYVGPVAAEKAPRTENAADVKPIDCIQPSILRLKDGRLKVLMRTRNGRLAESVSTDGGDSWSTVRLTDLPNNQSGTDAVTLRDGRHVLIYNDFSTLPGTKKGPRTPLSIAVSDDGETWRHELTLEDSPISQYSYPAIIQGRDGKVHCVYTWRRQRVAYKQLGL